MKALIASVVAVGVLAGGYLVLRVSDLSDQVTSLNDQLGTAQLALNSLEGSNEDKKQNAGLKELGDRLTLLEVSKNDADASAPAAAPAAGLSEVQAQLAVHDKDIAQLKKDLKGSSQVSSRLDEVADRFLGGGGRDSNGEREGGLNRLSELRTLFSGDSSELTPEQQQRREELTKQFQGQRDDWTI
ncbi:MAG: hypothetical protein VYB15_00375, partial [Planctomycetota bacterium]|nr:hypothetical protein [Planctomycetota bacterium]